MHRTSSRRLGLSLIAGSVATIAWGALAFGAVYPWAYVTLAIGCASIGVIILVVERHGRPNIRALAIGLAAIGFAIALQLVPLPAGMLARVSPGADRFLAQYDLSYLVGRAADENAAPGRDGFEGHPVTISPEHTLVGLALFSAFAVFLTGATRLLSARGAGTIVRPIVILGAVLALVGIVESTLWGYPRPDSVKIYGFWEPRFRGHPFGPFVNRNHFAGWMIMVLPLALAGAYAAWERGIGEMRAAGVPDRLKWISSSSSGSAVLLMFAATIMGLALMMCESRSGMAAFAASSSIAGWLVVRHQTTRWARAGAVAVVGLLFVGIVAWAGLDRMSKRLSSVRGDISTVNGRMEGWSDTTRMIRDFAITGTGLNTYGTATIVYQTGDRQHHLQEAHNDYLQLAAEGGLMVGLPVLVTLGIFIRDLRRRFREAPKTGTTYWMRVGAVIGLVSIALQSMVEFSLQMPGNAALFAVLAALALHQSPSLRATSRSRPIASS